MPSDIKAGRKGKLEGAKEGARNKSANKSPVGHGVMEGT